MWLSSTFDRQLSSVSTNLHPVISRFRKLAQGASSHEDNRVHNILVVLWFLLVVHNFKVQFHLFAGYFSVFTVQQQPKFIVFLCFIETLKVTSLCSNPLATTVLCVFPEQLS